MRWQEILIASGVGALVLGVVATFAPPGSRRKLLGPVAVVLALVAVIATVLVVAPPDLDVLVLAVEARALLLLLLVVLHVLSAGLGRAERGGTGLPTTLRRARAGDGTVAAR